ncbi:hypothetical protein WJ66_03790, partial [Stenotrophomonas maltophilia WJ66]
MFRRTAQPLVGGRLIAESFGLAGGGEFAGDAV